MWKSINNISFTPSSFINKYMNWGDKQQPKENINAYDLQFLNSTIIKLPRQEDIKSAQLYLF